MCLPYKVIEPYLHYYAGRFQNDHFEHWELVNEAWIIIENLTVPQFASAGVRWAMLRYMKNQYAQEHRGNKKSIIQSIDEEIGENLFCRNILAAPKDKQIAENENVEYAQCLLYNPRISFADRLLIDQRYFQGLTFRQIAKIYGCSRTNILHKLNKILNKLKRIAA